MSSKTCTTKTLDISDMPSIKSIEIEHDCSGDRLIITFPNGMRLDVTPENDGFHFYRPGEQETPTISVMTHISGEFQPETDKTIDVLLAKGLTGVNVFNYS